MNFGELQPADTKSVRLGFVSGLVPREKLSSFERVLFRATRGNMFLKQASIDVAVIDPQTGEKVEKVVFTIFFAGDRAKTKILKICDAFGATRYPFPEDIGRRRQMNADVNSRLQELDHTLEAGSTHRNTLLGAISSNLEGWQRTVRA